MLTIQGHLWGFDAQDLLLLLPEQDRSGFHTVILADIIYSNSEQSRLIDSVMQTLRYEPSACALVFFTPYRPWNLHKDLQFFPLAESKGFAVEKLLERKMDYVMFKNDPGVSIHSICLLSLTLTSKGRGAEKDCVCI
jgi:nicotinamide N-methyltransferase